jgi:hypothetical protein
MLPWRAGPQTERYHGSRRFPAHTRQRRTDGHHHGNDLDTYADDLAAVIETLDLH